MANKIFKALLNEKIEIFKNSFNVTAAEVFYNEEGKLIHPLEYGLYRENCCKEFIKFIIPSRLNIDEGFIINHNNGVSSQCDIVIFDSEHTPLFESGQHQRFFPIETIVAVGEVKSILSKTEFKKTINKLAKIKKIKKGINNQKAIYRNVPDGFSDIEHHFDNVISFLICKKLDFDLTNIVSDFENLYDKEIEFKDRHNFILSIEDGIMLYKKTEKEELFAWPYPNFQDDKLKNRYIKPGKDNKDHLNVFATYLFKSCQSGTIYLPAIEKYIGETFFGEYSDQI